MRLRNSFVLAAGMAAFFLVHSAYAQVKKDVSSSDEVAIKFQHPAKKGQTRTYLINEKTVPNAPLVPTTYSILPNSTYLIETEVIDLGRPALSFKVPVENLAEFNSVRILRLIKDDLSGTGYKWSDCTISVDAVQNWRDPRWLVEHPEFGAWYTERMKSQLPDFATRTVHCATDGEQWGAKEYLAVATQFGGQPSKRFTDLRFRLEHREIAEPVGEQFYTIHIENVGAKDAAEVNLETRFGLDTSLTAIRPSQGVCKSRPPGISGHVCLLGKLPAKASMTIEFRGAPSGGSNGEPVPPGPANKHWQIKGYAKENASDPNWPVNAFSFAPLLPNQDTERK